MMWMAIIGLLLQNVAVASITIDAVIVCQLFVVWMDQFWVQSMVALALVGFLILRLIVRLYHNATYIRIVLHAPRLMTVPGARLKEGA